MNNNRKVNHNSNVKGVITDPKLFFLAVFFVVIAFSIFFVPKEERRFVKDVESIFNSSKSNSIAIRDVTDFDWDYLCLIANTSSINDIEEQINVSLSNKSNYQRYWPFYLGALWFFKDEAIVKELNYNTLGLEISSKGLSPLNIEIDGSRYFFLKSDVPYKGSSCKDRDSAHLTKLEYPTAGSENQKQTRLIILTTQ